METTAAALKGFYLDQGTRGVNQELAEEFKRDRLPTKTDRRRALLGHALTKMPANPLTPAETVRLRHPKLLPEGTRQRLVEARSAARDRPAVTWPADGGFRVGELCGLHLVDLHLREGAACGECRAPHVHICHRENNPNPARVKTKRPWIIQDGVVRGTVRRASPAMVHTYFEYMTTEYPRGVEHGMLLLQLHGPNRGQPRASARCSGWPASAWSRGGSTLMPSGTDSPPTCSTPPAATA
ncbi:hypothetical protein [Streptosporangium sp. NPDC000396]|uniref:hypothetical protein n=1 Tax=Streptosporangium sp. NPDC000396 TaxID=3366185 RepID=UPI0036C1508E